MNRQGKWVADKQLLALIGKYLRAEVRQFIQGWGNYFGLSEYYRPIPLLDQWIRRRIRMCYLKQWRRIRLGVSKSAAISLGMSSKGYYRLAKTKAVQLALNNKWLKPQGLASVEEQWGKFHYS